MLRGICSCRGACISECSRLECTEFVIQVARPFCNTRSCPRGSLLKQRRWRRARRARIRTERAIGLYPRYIALVPGSMMSIFDLPLVKKRERGCEAASLFHFSSTHHDAVVCSRCFLFRNNEREGGRTNQGGGTTAQPNSHHKPAVGKRSPLLSITLVLVLIEADLSHHTKEM